MIYLDVTSACRSALNTGVKRIQRGLHRYLSGRPDYRPVCWQSARRAYRTLNEDDLATLEQARAPRGLALFDSFAPGFITDRLSYFGDRPSLLAWPDGLRDHDILLLPDLLWDNRSAWLIDHRQIPTRRIGVFHDAIALRPPAQSRIDRYHCRRGIRALAALDGVLCISHEAEHDLLQTWAEGNLNPIPTLVAPWPVPFTGARPASGPNFEARRLLYVARLEPHKNHLRLLDACEALWRDGLHFHLQLIGCLAYPDAAWRIWRRVRALRRQGFSVEWKAHVSEPGLHAAYRACSATVFPSLLEGFGLPIIESLWHGRPVVCGTNGALGEVSHGGGCEPVNPEDTESIAAGLRRVLTNHAHYLALQAGAANRTFRTWSDYWAEIHDFCHGRIASA